MQPSIFTTAIFAPWLSGLLAGTALASDPCPTNTGSGEWQALPAYPTPLAIEPTGTWYDDGQLYVYEAPAQGTRSSGGHVLDICSGTWQPFSVNEDAPEFHPYRPHDSLLDMQSAAGPAYLPHSNGQIVAALGAWSRPIVHMPRAYFGLHMLGGSTLEREDGSTITLPTEDAPSPRRPGTYVFVEVGEKLLVWGGLDEQGWTQDGAVFDYATESWSPMATADAPPAEFDVRVATWTGEHLLLFGAHRELLTPVGARYHVTDNRWESMTTEGMPSGLHAHALIAVWNHGRLVTVLSKPGPHTKGTIYDPMTDRTLEFTTPKTLYPHFNVRVGSAGPRLLFMNHAHVWASFLDPEMATWDEIPMKQNGLSSREEASMNWTGERLIVWGGRTREVIDPGGGCDDHDPSGGWGCDPVDPIYATEVFSDGAVYRPSL